MTAEIRETNGTVRRQTTSIGAMNRVERITYEPGRSLAIKYDQMGRPIAFDDAVQQVLVEYGRHGSFSGFKAPATGESLAIDGRPPPGVRTLVESHLAVFSGDVLGPVHPAYGPVRFAEHTFDALPLTAAEMGVPHLAAAHDLFAVALPLFGGSFEWIIRNFEKPSNPVFQPAEYRSTNCCVPYAGETCGPDGPSGPGGGGIQGFVAIVKSVDRCMRGSDERIRAIAPHRIQYDLTGFSISRWQAYEYGRSGRDRTTGAYVTALNIEEIERRATREGRSTKDVIHDVLAHEYAHHIRGEDEYVARAFARRLRNQTASCD